MVITECQICGKQIERPNGVTRYCGGECRKEANRRWQAEYKKRKRAAGRKIAAERPPAPLGAHVARPCVVCGEVMPDPARGQLYCSRRCKDRGPAGQRTTEKQKKLSREQALQERDRRIFALCRETGLSYGKVVSRYGL